MARTLQQVIDQDPTLNQYSSNRLLVQFMAWYLGHDDREQLAADSLVDHSNDKKVDAVYVDTVGRRALVCQSYLSDAWGVKHAPANKAAGLSSAMSWLLIGDLDTVPTTLRQKALELRSAIQDQEIDSIELIYVHNCIEHVNPRRELDTVAQAVREILQSDQITISALEFGVTRIQVLYDSLDKSILVDDVFELPDSFRKLHQTQDWTSLVGSVSGAWLFDLISQHGDKVFSANVRDYLGSRGDKRNINNAIKSTVLEQPGNFFIYNNGITVICNSIDEVAGRFKIQGLSIVNGAQTSGAIHEAGRQHAELCNVPCRIICSSQDGLIRNVIKFNNTQNSVRASDRRSNDRVQKRLADEFKSHKIAYVHRRTGSMSPKDSISAESIGQSLAAFHGFYTLSTRNRSNIFENETDYRKLFNDQTNAGHAFIVHCLSMAVDTYRTSLRTKVDNNEATKGEVRQHSLMKFVSSKQLVMFLVGSLTENIFGRTISTPFSVQAKDSVMRAGLISHCQSGLPLLDQSCLWSSPH